MEFMDRGSLYDVVKMCIKMDERLLAFVVHEIVQALKFIHEKKRVHRDIKVDNVLISSKGEVKLGALPLTLTQALLFADPRL